MFIVKIIAVFCLLGYIGILIYSVIGHIRSKEFAAVSSPSTNVCIIVCARNEEKHIELCLLGILAQNFPKELIEIIVVNDASSDKTLELSEKVLSSSGVSYQIISNTEKLGKKISLNNAIHQSKGDLIITRDADTFTPSLNWLGTLVSFHQGTQKEFIIAPVALQKNNSFIGQLQSSECDALAILTSGFAAHQKAFLCNGANLAFTKNIFKKVKGYSSHLGIASGDDVLFLEDVKKTAPSTISYLKNAEATVYSYPQLTLSQVIDQKVRWAAKADVNPNQFNQILAFLVLFVHLFTWFFLAKAIFTHQLPLFGLFFVFSRFLIDFLLLFLASRYFKKAVFWPWIIPVWFSYSFLVITVGILSWFYKPKWK